jgi:hypothetical protein
VAAADAPLCDTLLRAARGDAAVADLLYRRSGLFDERWDRTVPGGLAYGQATIAAAVRSRDALLGIGPAPALPPGADAGAGGMVRLDRVRPEPVAWLWPGRLFLGEVVLLVGEPAAGKSSLAMELAARVTAGGPWPDGADNTPGGVVFVAPEDSVATTLRPRFAAAGGRLRRAHHYSTSGRPDVL